MATKKSAVVLVAFAVFTATCVHADTKTAIWTNTNARITNDAWGMPHLWTDADGVMLEVAPTNASDNYTVKLSEVTTGPLWDGDNAWLAGEKHVKLLSTGPNSGQGGNSTLAGVDPVIDSIVADNPVFTHRYTIFNAPWVGMYTWPLARSFSVRNPNGYFGLFDSNNANATWEFRADPDFTPVAYGIHTAYGPHICVPTANTLAKVTGVDRSGAIVKDGAGTLEVMGGGSDSHYVVNEGTLRLCGPGSTEKSLVEGLLAEALVHLDVSDASSLVKSNGEGRVWITRWNDVRGNDVYAYPDPHDYDSKGTSLVNYPNPTFVSSQTSPTGLPLADFGVRASMASPTDVSNCYMRLSRNFDNVRDAVIVAALPYGAQSATILGHTERYDWMSDGTYGRLFTCGYAPFSVAYGKFAVNGGPCTYDDLRAKDIDWTRVNVVHAQPIADTSVNLLGTDRRYVTNTGNSRIGEIILFNRELSAEERAAIDRHLVAKWLDGKNRSAEGVLLKGGAAIDVASGHEAYVDRVSAEEGAVVKTGEGILAVADIVSESQEFDVRGGSVRFASNSVPANSPAGNPYVWLDASKDSTMTVGEKGVTTWRDCRDGSSLAATAVSTTTGGKLATKRASACNNLQTLDFGQGASASGTQSYMTLPNGKNDTYAGFMVVKFNVAAHYFMFGSDSSDMTFFRSAGKIGVGDATGAAYVQREVAAAYWTINGIPRDSYTEYSELLQTDEYFVIAFKSAVPLTLNRIAVDRDTGNNCGNICVGEFISYHEPVSPDEFRQTEAYLLKKWLNRDTCANIATVAKMTFPLGQDAVIDSDRDITVRSIVGGNGRIVKKGSGRVTVFVSPMADHIPSVDIRGGSIDVQIDHGVTEEAIFHFDASDLSTLTYTVDGNGVTNVQYVADVRNNGVRGRSAYDAAFSPANRDPQLTTVETKPGVSRPVLDFFKTYYIGQSVQDGSALLLQKDGANHIFNNVREVFFIVAQNADTTGLCCNSWFTADFGNGSAGSGAALKWGRNSYSNPDTLLGAGFTAYLYPGFYNANSASIDGVDGAATSLKLGSADGFKLVELRPGQDASAAVFAAERCGYAVGGYKLGEMMAFSRELSADERAYVRQKLRAKWFEDADMPIPAPPASISLSIGATVDYAGGVLAPTPLVVTVPKGVEEGSYTLLRSADGFTTDAFGVWESLLTIDNKSVKAVRVAITGSSIVAEIMPRGLVVNFR